MTIGGEPLALLFPTPGSESGVEQRFLAKSLSPAGVLPRQSAALPWRQQPQPGLCSPCLLLVSDDPLATDNSQPPSTFSRPNISSRKPVALRLSRILTNKISCIELYKTSSNETPNCDVVGQGTQRLHHLAADLRLSAHLTTLRTLISFLNPDC